MDVASTAFFKNPWPVQITRLTSDLAAATRTRSEMEARLTLVGHEVAEKEREVDRLTALCSAQEGALALLCFARWERGGGEGRRVRWEEGW